MKINLTPQYRRINSMGLWSSVGLILMVFSFANAQNTDPCGCNEVLRDGVYRYRVERGDSDAQSEMERDIAQTSHVEFMKRRALGGGGSYAGIGVNFNMSKEDYEKKQGELREKHRDWQKVTSSKELIEKFGDENVLK